MSASFFLPRLAVSPNPSRPPPAVVAICLATGSLVTACGSDIDVEVRLAVPLETDALASVDNVSIVLEPQSLGTTVDVDGPPSHVSGVLPADATQTTMTAYLAQGAELRGWGRTVPFAVAPVFDDMTLLVGLPGRLASFPDPSTSTPTSSVLAARAENRGVVVLREDGATSLLSHYTYQLEAAQPLLATIRPDDGGLFAAGDGTVVRLVLDDEVAAWRFDPSVDRWTSQSVPASSELGPRRSAIVLVDGNQRVLAFGGGGRTDAVAIDLVGHSDHVLAVSRLAGEAPIVSRDGGTAVWIDHGPDHERDVLLFGAADPLAPRVAWWGHPGWSDMAVGSWVGAACVAWRVDRSDQETGRGQGLVRAVCGGGRRDGEITADAVRVDHVLGQPPTVVEMPGLLPVALADPRAVQDDDAVYFQGDGVWIVIDKADLVPRIDDRAALRATGGVAVSLPTGATFWVGGTGVDGLALARWQVFVPKAG